MKWTIKREVSIESVIAMGAILVVLVSDHFRVNQMEPKVEKLQDASLSQALSMAEIKTQLKMNKE